MDVLAGLARATFDAIGLAGFGYAFEALKNEHENELAKAFEIIFSTGREFRVMTVLQTWIPFLRRFVSSRG
jgi:hypothetical protein